MDDPNSLVFTDAIMVEAMGEAVDALNLAYLTFQIPREKVITSFQFNASAAPTPAARGYQVTPASIGIDDFGELIYMRERAWGSLDEFRHVWEVDDLWQRDPTDILGQFEWRADSFWFTGCTTPREVQLAYFTSSSILDTNDMNNGSTGIDSSLTFLSKYTVGAAGPRKGRTPDTLGVDYMVAAVGSRYNDGITGGELFRLCQHQVRERQRVQVAPKPYSVIRRRLRRQPPYIAAPGGAAGVSGYFSTVEGTITPLPDGSTTTFFTSFPVQAITLSRNGLVMTPFADYTFGANQIVFLPGQIPQTGDNLYATWAGAAGTNVTIVNAGPGGGGGNTPTVITYEDPTPLPNGVATVFSFSATPKSLIYNGLTLFAGIGYTLVSGTQVRLIDPLGATITPTTGDSLKALM